MAIILGGSFIIFKIVDFKVGYNMLWEALIALFLQNILDPLATVQLHINQGHVPTCCLIIS